MDDGNEIVTVTDLILLAETKKAILVRQGDDECWLPLSQLQNINYGENVIDDETGVTVREIDSLDMPQWLAENNNLM